ncbi:MAG: cell division protein SepF [Actinomycetota bacterium]|nr:cell division protein SepF [Actinomycetota bacterium]
MAASFMRRAMAYLGLAEDEYDDFGRYDEPETPIRSTSLPRTVSDEPAERTSVVAASTIRPVPRDNGSDFAATPRPAAIRPMSPEKGARVHVATPTRFADAKDIADHVMDNQPVIVNLQVADKELQRRMIDFCSGVAYTLHGAMEKVADQVFLLTPSNVEVSAEERKRLQERGLLRP